VGFFPPRYMASPPLLLYIFLNVVNNSLQKNTVCSSTIERVNIQLQRISYVPRSTQYIHNKCIYVQFHLKSDMFWNLWYSLFLNFFYQPFNHTTNKYLRFSSTNERLFEMISDKRSQKFCLEGLNIHYHCTNVCLNFTTVKIGDKSRNKLLVCSENDPIKKC
jgi:hypothetical protein